MKTFIFHWLDNTKTISRGDSVANAFMCAGYSADAIGALDYYEERAYYPHNKR